MSLNNESRPFVPKEKEEADENEQAIVNWLDKSRFPLDLWVKISHYLSDKDFVNLLQVSREFSKNSGFKDSRKKRMEEKDNRNHSYHLQELYRKFLHYNGAPEEIEPLYKLTLLVLALFRVTQFHVTDDIRVLGESVIEHIQKQMVVSEEEQKKWEELIEAVLASSKEGVQLFDRNNEVITVDIYKNQIVQLVNSTVQRGDLAVGGFTIRSAENRKANIVKEIQALLNPKHNAAENIRQIQESKSCEASFNMCGKPILGVVSGGVIFSGGVMIVLGALRGAPDFDYFKPWVIMESAGWSGLALWGLLELQTRKKIFTRAASCLRNTLFHKPAPVSAEEEILLEDFQQVDEDFSVVVEGENLPTDEQQFLYVNNDLPTNEERRLGA